MTCGPLRARPSLSLPWRERTWFQRFGETRAPASLPSQGRSRGVLRRRESAIALPVDRSSLKGRTSCSGRSHPQSLVSSPSFRKARTEESQSRRGPRIRGPAGGEAGSRARAGRGGIVPSPFWPIKQKRGRPRPEPEGRLCGMSLQADRGDQRLDVPGLDVPGKDTISDLHRALRRLIERPTDSRPFPNSHFEIRTPKFKPVHFTGSSAVKWGKALRPWVAVRMV